ncbi:DMT family transporter [Cohaesibacter haloalkalitolerans]|uniref:DMT family transporter n=1 Tax=Cohaesibacter haloalkalitolerans TaxID=1162980 RepID=UPI0013C4F165|nr:DMT family transporter [Cohaesibacter haloalkalitolerans]
MQTHSIRHWLILAFLILCWASAIILTRVIATELTPIWLTAARVSSGAVALILYRVLIVKKPWSLGRHHIPWVIWLALISSAVPFVFLAWGSQYTSSAIAGILIGTVPLSVLGLAHFLLPDEKMTRSKALGFLIGFAGLVLIIKPDNAPSSSEHTLQLLGELAIFFCSLCYAMNTVSSRMIPPADNLDKATAVVATSSLLLLIAGLALEPVDTLLAAPAHLWLILIYLGIVPTALATLMVFVLLSQTTATFLATSNYLIPIATALGGILFLGESLTWVVWLGFAIILAGVAISSRPGRRAGKQQA